MSERSCSALEPAPGLRLHGGSHVLLLALAVAAVSRLGLWLAGVLAFLLLPSGAARQPGNLFWHQPVTPALEVFARWDAEWYLLVAERGYDVGDELRALGLRHASTDAAGFLPLYPLLIRCLAPLTGAVGAGVLVSHLAFFLAVVLLFRFTAAEVGEQGGDEAGLVAVAALAAFPTSLFLSAVYAESLFLALSLGALWCARQRRMAVAGVLGGLAAVTRPFGVFLVLPLAMEWWRHHRNDRARVSGLAALLLVPAGFAGYLVYCWRLFGDPLVYFHQKTGWRGGLGGPWTAFLRWWETGPAVHGTHGSSVELVFAVAAMAGLVVMARRLRASLVVYSVVCVASALGSSLWSFGRLVLVVFPFFVLVGVLWSRGVRWPALVLLGIGGPLGGVFMAMFANWWWVG